MKPDQVVYDGGENPQPMDRLTRVADAGRTAMHACPDWQQGDKLIISISGEREDGLAGGGMFVHGYGPDDEELEAIPVDQRDEAGHKLAAAEIVAVLMEHAEAILAEALGMQVRIVPVNPARIDQVMPFIAHLPN